MVLEFGQHRKRASPDLSIYIYSSISISTYIYICVYLLFAWNQLQWPTLRTSLFWAFLSVSFSFEYLPMKWIAKPQNPKFWKMLVLAWWCWNLTDIIRELALIYLSTSIHLYLYLQICIYIYACISCLHGISCSDTHLEHHCFEHSSLSPSLFQIPTHQMDY